MAKRSRALYEADLQAQQSPFVAFGTPLPPLDPDVRDDGSFVPVWKQEVRDEQGRRRFHGAFTGGFSAGYYNTVGSKEGWTPSTFVSSRTNRRKDNPDAAPSRPEDYMDDEDLADAEEARKIQTSQAFAGLGLTEHDPARPAAAGATGGALAGLFRASGETMGARLLKKMGWKEGQGIGPKVRRAARLGVGKPGDGKATFLFAPEDAQPIRLVKKTDRKGLGFEGEARLASARGAGRDASDDSDDSGDGGGSGGMARGLLGRSSRSIGSANPKSAPSRSGGFGVGVLNDTGSDDDADPYDLGPRMSFSRAIGGDKKKKKKTAPKPAGTTDNGGAAGGGNKPRLVFSAARPGRLSRGTAPQARVCHDGRPPLSGFVLARRPDALTSEPSGPTRYPAPAIPPGWRSAKQPRAKPALGQPQQPAQNSAFVSAAEAAKASTLDPKARAAALGESQLPGKSVFDFLSPEARDRIAAATGKTDLPQARGEVPAAFALTAEQKRAQLLQAVPALDKATAVAAITRGARGGGPYQDDEAKRARYRAYLEHQAGIANAALPPKPAGVRDDDWLRELHEFVDCARIFKPMSGPMASRFTAASASSLGQAQAAGGPSQPTLVTRPTAPKPPDPAEEAARMGMYGPMTRTVTDFFPARLLCKRMGVKPPPILPPDPADRDSMRGAGAGGGWSSASSSVPGGAGTGAAAAPTHYAGPAPGPGSPQAAAPKPASQPGAVATIEADKNEALEGQRAGEDVFRAVFGDSDDDDDEDEQ